MSNKEFILSNTRIIFCGTPLIASKILQTLLDLKANVIACISQPDRELDRKKNIIFSETKKITIDNNIKLFQPEKISTIYNEINELKPDLIITCAYGQFITENILNIPKIGAINIHTSLLPELRGGAPIHHAIIKNKSKTGVSLMKMIKKMDAGDILFQKEVEISSEDTYDDLYLKLMQTSSDMIKDHLHDIIFENYIPIVQNENKVTFALNIKLEETFINFDKPSKEIYNLIRGLCSKPCAKINFNNSIIKIWESEISNFESNLKPGTISNINKTGIYIATKDYDICFKKIQLPSKKPAFISDIINGNIFFKINDYLN